MVALLGEAYAEVRSRCQESATLLRETGLREELVVALALLGYAAQGLGNLPVARQHLHEALQLVAETRVSHFSLMAIPAVALLLADTDEVERAVELYALASCYGFVGNSRWFEDVAGRYIAATAAELPPDMVAAAQARGRTRDLETTVAELLEELGSWIYPSC